MRLISWSGVSCSDTIACEVVLPENDPDTCGIVFLPVISAGSITGVMLAPDVSSCDALTKGNLPPSSAKACTASSFQMRGHLSRPAGPRDCGSRAGQNRQALTGGGPAVLRAALYSRP